MQRFLLLALFGLIAQLIDGSLGMAYGLTTTSLLLTGGVAPAVASASVHLAEVGTTFVSGIAHSRLGNTNWQAVIWLALPGGVGAFAGAVVLSNLAASVAAPIVAAFLLLLGCYLLARFTLRWQQRKITGRRPPRRYLVPLGVGAGFLDAAGGGGWGPIATPTLLTVGRMQPRQVVGTVDTSEFVVATAASLGFLLALRDSAVAFTVVGALLLGGVIAAPIAAWLVRILHPRMLGSLIGGLIIATNARVLLREFDAPPGLRLAIYTLIAAVWLAALVSSLAAVRAERRAPARLAVAGD